MPDSHQGFGMPIGGVLATKDVIIPNAVGVDIGCGMYAIKTSLTEIDKDTLKKIMGEIRKSIPVGFNHQKEKQDELLRDDEFPNNRVLAGYRYCSSAALSNVGSGGYYWSSSVTGSSSYYLDFNSSSATMNYSIRAYGFSVRCVRD